MVLTTKDKIKFLKIAIITLLIVSTIFVVVLLMVKYSIEGENKSNLPFYIDNIAIASTADGIIKSDKDYFWYGDLVQINDIYIKIQKNENKDSIIKNIFINNFNIEKQTELFGINISRIDEMLESHTYPDKNLREMQFVGNEKNSLTDLTVGEQGGTVGFRILLDNLGTYKSNDTKISYDGTLLKYADINIDELKCKINFELIIETEKGIKYQTNISVEIPSGDIIKEGYIIKELNEMDLIYKRI